MRRLLVVVVLIMLAASAMALSKADATSYSSAYYALRDNLLVGQRPHQEWVEYLERNPAAYVPPDVGSLQHQREFVEVYNRRLYAIWLLANGVTHWPGGGSIFETTYADFEWNRAQHLRQTQWSYTYSGRDMQYFFVNQYEWRLSMLKSIAAESVTR